MSKVLFDSLAWLDENPQDYVDEYLECTGQTKEDFESEEELLEAVTEWLQADTEHQWNDFLKECSDEKGFVLVTGYFMAWNGPREGGLIFKDLKTAVSGAIMEGDSHPVFSITDEGVMVLDETHHDAPCNGNHYEFRVLTKRGAQYYQKHIYDKYDNRRALCEALKEKGRSRDVNVKVFGFSTVTLR